MATNIYAITLSKNRLLLFAATSPMLKRENGMAALHPPPKALARSRDRTEQPMAAPSVPNATEPAN